MTINIFLENSLTFFIPLEPRRLLLCYSPLQFIFSGAHDCLRQLSPNKVNKKSVSAESASLKIGFSSLKVRNLPSFLYGFKQTDFLRFVPPIFLTLTSQGGNQGILRSASYLFKRSQKSVFAEISDRLRLILFICRFSRFYSVTIHRNLLIFCK
jgi:hypothetical protein